MHVSRRINYACRLVLPYEFLFERQFSLRSRQAEAAGFRPRRPDAGVETGPGEAALQLLPGRGGAGGGTVKSFLRRSPFFFSLRAGSHSADSPWSSFVRDMAGF